MTQETDLRCRLVAAARSWLGTPYHHHARIKGLGVDCAQLVAAVAEEAGAVPSQDLGQYAREWHLHHGEELYLQGLELAGATRLSDDTEPTPGDVLVFRFGRTFSHGAVVIEGGADPLLAHAYVRQGVILSRLSEAPLAGRKSQLWSIANGRQ